MKQLTLEETRLKEEMKQRCLSKGQYTDENAKAKFEMLCHLEDFEIQYWELQKENKQLKDSWNKLKDSIDLGLTKCPDNQVLTYMTIKNKIEDLERRNHINE